MNVFDDNISRRRFIGTSAAALAAGAFSGRRVFSMEANVADVTLAALLPDADDDAVETAAPRIRIDSKIL